MKAIILLGAPGSGKGTVAEDLVSSTEYSHISTGDMLRESVKAETSLGVEAKGYMDAGELVPDELIMRIVKERLAGGPADAKYMFDGFPRTTEQAVLFDALLTEATATLTDVFLLEVDRAVLLKRIAGRRVCKECNAVYHRDRRPPARPDICDDCGGEVYQRKDDNEETVLNRLSVYKAQTVGLIKYYEDRGLLRCVAAEDRKETELAILGILEGTQ